MRVVGAIVVAQLVISLAGCARATDKTVARPSNILLITIDTLRADRVGGALTPTLNHLGSRGLRFSNARSTVPLTLPAHASIMTGLLPTAHGARINGVPVPRAGDSIAVRLQRAGYRTAAAVGAFVLDRRFGLAEGFDSYDDVIARDPRAVDQLQAERRANVVVDAAIAWLKSTNGDRPWFLWVHLYDPHAPYNAPRALPADATPADAYDQEVAFADGELTRLLQEVLARSDAAATAIIALGDHGESLGEHGEMTHGMLLYDAALKVPLIVSGPGISAAVRDDPATVVDVLPTALALAGQPRDAALAGRNLLEGPNAEREVYAETQYPAVAGWQPARALVQDRWKLTLSTRAKLFDVKVDPAESNDVAVARASVAQAMQKRLEEISRPAVSPPDRTKVDADTAARLRALGYVAPSSPPPGATQGVDAADVIGDWVKFEHALGGQNAGRPSEAVAIFDALRRKHPDGSLFQTSFARALAQLGRSREALDIYKRAVARWPGDADLYHELAVTAREAGDRAEAARAEDAALALAPNLPTAENGRGLLYADAGQHDEAEKHFRRAVELDSTNGLYMVNLGNAQRALGRLDAAEHSYRRALARDPSLVDAANGLGVILVQQKRATEAIPLLEQAVKQDPKFAEAQLNLGIALQESGQRERAVAQYELVERAPFAARRERDAAQALRRQLQRR